MTSNDRTQHDAPGIAAEFGLPSDEIAGFRLLRLLGRGGMGMVFEAEQRTPRRRVALKLLHSTSALEPSAVERFAREGDALGRLDHPSIVTVFEVGEDRGAHYIAQELVAGGRTLAHRIAEVRQLPRLPADYFHEVARLFAEVAEALAKAHENGVLHRDVKPGNVLLTPDGTPKVADFGLARLHDAATLSATDDVMGSVPYMSPEQVDPKLGRPDERSDVFSLGVALYEALTLVRPFVGASDAQIMHNVLRFDPPDPRVSVPKLPDDLAVIAQKAIEKRREQRYATMSEMAADLRRHLNDEPILARPPGILQRTGKWARRHPVLASTGALGLVALVAIVGLLVQVLAANDLAAEQLDIVDRIKLSGDLRELRGEAQALWPIGPELRSEYEAWIARANALVATVEGPEGHIRFLEERAPQISRHPWLGQQLEKLVQDIEELADPETGLLMGRSEEFGLGVHTRLERLEEFTAPSPDLDDAWAAVADRTQRSFGFRVRPVLGLVPIGQDPRTELEEFAHLLTGQAPERDERDRLLFDDKSSLVLVLLPGGSFWMGSQTNLDEPNYDEAPGKYENPIEEVSLRPFLISKFEMTGDQWERLTGNVPSSFVGPLLPVEQVSWTDCSTQLQRASLAFPTEAQWEYAARAGTESPWSTGIDETTLDRYANLADLSCDQTTWVVEDWLNDGHANSSVVGTFKPNPFGLYDVHGNLWEWVRDSAELYATGERDDDGVVLEPRLAATHILRGGSWNTTAELARSAYRYIVHTPEFERYDHGVRPAMSVSIDQP